MISNRGFADSSSALTASWVVSSQVYTQVYKDAGQTYVEIVVESREPEVVYYELDQEEQQEQQADPVAWDTPASDLACDAHREFNQIRTTHPQLARPPP